MGSADAEDARRRQRHPHGHHEEQDHGDGHPGGADGEEEKQGRDRRHGPHEQKPRPAAPGRRQSRSMLRAREESGEDEDMANAIRTQSTTLVGASVQVTREAGDPHEQVRRDHHA